MLAQQGILTKADGDCVAVERPDGNSAVLLICEHASRALPERFGDLGLSAEALSSHIAWDPGALAVARGISAGLNATLVFQRFSRLIYDCNRPRQARSTLFRATDIWARRIGRRARKGFIYRFTIESGHS